MLLFSFFIVLMFTLVSYTSDFIRGGDSLALNDIALTSAVSEIDQMSRLNEGTLILEDSFEEKAWSDIAEKYPDGSEVQFDYYFDQDRGDFEGVPEKLSSELYEIANKTPRDSSAVFIGKPVKAIRVKIRDAGDKVTSDGKGWTYTSTIKLDVSED